MPSKGIQLKANLFIKQIDKAKNRHIKAAIMKAFKVVSNRIIANTLPNNGIAKGKSPSDAVRSVKGIRLLQKRVKEQLIGDGQVASGIALGFPRLDSLPFEEPVLDTLYLKYSDQDKKRLRVPFVAFASRKLVDNHFLDYPISQKAWKKRKDAAKIENNPESILKYYDKKARFRRNKKGVLYRYFPKKVPYIWVTPTAIKQAAKKLSARAGKLISGWGGLCELVGNTKVLEKLLSSTGSTAEKTGLATRWDGFGEVKIRAVNNTVKNNQGRFAPWQQAIIEKNVEKWMRGDVKREVNYTLDYLLNKGLKQYKKKSINL